MFVFYAFLVSFFSLLVFYISAVTGVGDLSRSIYGLEWSGDYWVGAISVAIVAGLLWVFHWRNLNTKTARSNAGYRGLIVFHLFIMTLLFALGLLITGSGALSSLAGLFFRGNPAEQWATFTASWINLFLTFGLWFYHFPILRILSAADNAVMKASRAK